MTMYINLNDPDARPVSRLKTLLPDVSDPDRLTAEELESLGVAECVVTREPLEWWQTHGERARDNESSPVTITYPAIGRPIDEVREIAKHRIDAERDRRQELPIECNGHTFQTRPIDRENLLGAALDALMWVTSGGDPDTLFWDVDNPSQAQGWIAIGNDVVPLTAAQMMEFGRKVKARHAALVFEGRMRKDAVMQAASVAKVVDAAGWE